TSALIRLAHPEKRVVYFTVGHGERDLAESGDGGYSKIKAGLERQNYTVQTLNLLVTNTIPSDAAAIVVAGPQVTYTVTETLVLSKYFDGGGGGIFLIDPTIQVRQGAAGDDPLVDWLAKSWGVNVGNDVVVDPASSRPDVAFAQGYGSSPITEKLLSQNLTSVYPLARSIGAAPTSSAASPPQVTSLVSTGPEAWGEFDFNSLNSGPKFDKGTDQPGPVSLAVTADNPSNKARIVVFGDSDFATNFFAEQYANGDMLYNSVNWVTGNTDLISIPPKDQSFRAPLDLSTRTIATFGLVSLCVLPFGMLLIGAAVVWNRRTRYK
ncbi:MAG: Gldg family protein, partial [Chloroflexi bacterium]|nr:Gldg family protein [Chloroflexota bacterium]